ncbi:hypothetical protein M3Y95_00695000 [Aphelenchoides besseyi]|nr:hypothetical protein M3Y95_00695000 [Aphelenchoides besseyi]
MELVDLLFRQCLVYELLHLLLSVVFISQCLYSRAWKRERQLRPQVPNQQPQPGLRADGRVRVVPFVEPPDAATEAALRHDMMRFYPKLQLQPESITNSNYQTIKTRFEKSLGKHPTKEPQLPERPLCTNKITFDDTCLVYVVYGNDVCRGEAEKEENTLDEAIKPQENQTISSDELAFVERTK